MTDTPHAGQDQAPDLGPLQDDVGVEGAQDTAPPSDPPQEPVAGPPYETPEEMAQRVKELTADLQRLQAEYVNYKRRVDRDRELVLQNAKYSILSALLPVLDDIERAKQHAELSGPMAAIAEKLDASLARFGVERFGTVGEEFDPTVHEALMHNVDAEATATTVSLVVEPGYRIGDRVVRAARVGVVGPE